MRVTALRIVLLGTCEPGAREWIEPALSRLPRTAVVERSERWNVDWPQRAALSDLCIVFQSWPDEIPLHTAHALIAACSTGRLICCQGAWCASAGRTRATWPPAVCVPIEQFASRITFELDVLAGRRAPVPATASRDEAFAAHYAFAPDAQAVPVRVNSPDPAYARELQRAVQTSATDACGNCTVQDSDLTSSVARRREGAVQITVAGFPRHEPISASQAAGAHAIVSKLAPLSELLSVVNRAVANQS